MEIIGKKKNLTNLKLGLNNKKKDHQKKIHPRRGKRTAHAAAEVIYNTLQTNA